jgi:hypothetical protein
MLLNRNTLIALMLLAVTTAFSTAIMAADATPTKFVGTYAFSNNDPGNITASTTLHKDGTTSTIEPNMFSDDLNNSYNGRRNTPRQGVWRKVGIKKVRVTQLSFLSGGESHDYFTGGENDGVILKLSFLLVFDKPVNGVLMTYKVRELLYEIFLQNQNPTTDDPVRVIELPEVLGKAYRLSAK